MMTVKRQSLSALLTMGLALVLMVVSGQTSYAQDVETPVTQVFETDTEYSVSLRAPSTILRHRNAELIVRVRNAQGEPVDGVPVVFQVDPAWNGEASVFPQRVLTHRGTASTMLRADLVGVVGVTAQVGKTTKRTQVAVSLPGGISE